MATIDGKNILSTWNMTLLTGSYDSLFKYPKRTAVKYTNFAEVDGINPLLSRFETEQRRVSLNFMIRHNSESEFRGIYDDFFNEMLSDGYRTVNPENGLVYELRYDKTQKAKSIRLYDSDGGTMFTMDFIEDVPAIDPNITMPTGGINLKGVYSINAMDFGDFGVHPDGEIGEMLKYADVKDAFFDGRIYHLLNRKTKHREVTLNFWMLSHSKSEFVTNYQAFYNAFAMPDKQHLYSKEAGGTAEVYYVDCGSYKVLWSDSPAARFSIKLCIPVVEFI